MSLLSLPAPESLVAWSAVLSAFASIVVAIFTWQLARLTRILSSETRLARERQERADVESAILINEKDVNLIELVVRNVGASTARNFHIRTFENTANDGKERHRPINMKLANFFSGTEIRFFVGQYDELLGSPLRGSISYEDSRGRHDNPFKHNFDDWKNIIRIDKPPAFEISDTLKKLEKSVTRLARGSSRLKVDAFDQDDRMREHEEHLGKIAELRAKTVEAKRADNA